MNLHNHYTFLAYDKMEDIRFVMPCEVSVSATSEEDGIKKAQLIVKRKHYYLQKAWECYQDHNATDMAQHSLLKYLMKANDE